MIQCYSVGPKVSEDDRDKFRTNLAKKKIHEAIKAAFPSAGIVHLSTCNRIELYMSNRSAIDDRALFATLEIDEFHKHIVKFEGKEAIRHLFNVCCGTKSNAFLETSIAGQVGIAYEEARKANATDRTLNILFQRAKAVSARVKNQTGVGDICTSTEALAAKRYDHLKTARNVLLLGTGKSAQLLLHQLIARKPGKIIVASSSFERATEFVNTRDEKGSLFNFDAATQVQCVGYKSEEFSEALRNADAIFAATKSLYSPLVSCEQLFENVKHRRAKLLVVDLSSPKVIELLSHGLEGLERQEAMEQLANLNQITQITIDDLKTEAQEAEKQKKALLPVVNAIIDPEVDSIQRLLEANLLSTFNSGLSAFVKREVEKAIQNSGLADEKIARRLAERVANAVSHPLRTAVRAKCDDEFLIRSLLEAFGIE